MNGVYNALASRVFLAAATMFLASAGLLGCPAPSGPTPTTVVPSTSGMSYEAALAALSGRDLLLDDVIWEHHPTVPKDQVLRSVPGAGTIVPVGSRVILVLSDGPEEEARVSVPDLVNMTRNAAEAALRGVDLEVGTISQESSDTIAEGRVIRHTPAKNFLVFRGTQVNLVISLGRARAIVPDLRGQLLEAAEELLEEASLQLGTVSEEYSEVVPEGRVIRSTPAEGTTVNFGTTVSVVVSLGPNPIEIGNVTDLQKIGNDPNFPLNGNYVLTNMIDANATAVWNGGSGFKPIGTSSSRFTGRFDGRGFSVNGLVVNRQDTNHIGVFGYVGPTAQIINLNVGGGAMTGLDYVGGIVGYNDGGQLLNCSSSANVSGRDYLGGIAGLNKGAIGEALGSGSVSGRNYLGGIAGRNEGSITATQAFGLISGTRYLGGFSGSNLGSIAGSDAIGAVTATGEYIGGFSGYNNGTIAGCGAAGTVSSTRGFATYIGGFVGYNNAGVVSQCMASGDVEASSGDYVGGFVGYHYGGTVSQSIANGGNVTGSRNVGGFAGLSRSSINQSYALCDVKALSSSGWAGGFVGGSNRSSIVQCYAVGLVEGGARSGGLVGGQLSNNTHVVTGSFWDIQTSGVTESEGGLGLTTVQMKARVNFTAASWDFVHTWGINEGVSYPYLLWTLESE